jgi:tetratricopeptide (TPR) repeat protein
MPLAAESFRMALAGYQSGQIDDAQRICRQIVADEPRCAEAWWLLGSIAHKQRQFASAVECLRQAVAANPNEAMFHDDLGTALSQLDDPLSAATSYRRALELQPERIETHNNLGNTLRRLGEWDAAILSYHQALELRPDFAQAHNNLGNAYREQGELPAAVACYRRAIELRPESATAHHNLGVALVEQAEYAAAESCYDRAIELQPGFAESHFSRSRLRLLIGDFERGWAEFEWRSQTTRRYGVADFQQPRWTGQPIAGKTILLHHEQGLGDTLQFVRYAALAKRLGATVIVGCQSELAPLLKTVRGVDYIVTSGNAIPAFDYHVSLLSLPAIVGTTLSTIPAEIPYVHADPKDVERWRPKIGAAGERRVGIVWQGSADHHRDRLRSFRPECFLSLARIPGVRLYSLQKGPGREQLSELHQACEVVDLADELTTFAETAAAMANLDLIISCDSAPAHLAGALGLPVWVPLPFVPDWRWLLGRDDSPWYPTMRLFRQQESGNWTGVFERMVAEWAERRQEPARAQPN